MARNRDATMGEPSLPQAEEESRLLEEVVALLSLTGAAFSLLSFLAYHSGHASRYFAGRVGSELASAVVQSMGLAAYLLPLFLGAVAVIAFRQATAVLSLARLVGVAVGVVLVATLCALVVGEEVPVTVAGGWMGGFIAVELRRAFGSFGSYLVVFSALVLCVMFLTRQPLRRLGVLLFATLRAAGGRLLARRPTWPRRGVIEEETEVAEARERRPFRKGTGNVKRPPPDPAEGPVIVLTEVDEPPRSKKAARRRMADRQEELPLVSRGAYQSPPIGFLEKAQNAGLRVDEETLRKSSQILEAKLADFGIQGRVVEVHPGPVITTFHIEPAPGVKVNRIVSLSDDLAMALRVPGVRILAPVPGKAVVGIEVANPHREEVRLREMIESDAFQGSASPLTLALGKDTAGGPVIGDLARMPHLLIAGATGSGKSVAINTMIMSILYKADPSEVRFVMIDLKMLELSIYEEIPHLLVPVVTDPKKAVVVLNNIVEEMEQRYRSMKDRSVRGVDGYNRLIDRELEERSRVVELNQLADDEETEDLPPPPPEPERLTKIVVIIDELADLMMTMGRKVEEPITRLAQKARAAGIHLVLATQRPSVDVITGLIKANFPARVSFQTVSRVDSRTILDHIGAERLLGGGDMLYMPPGTARLQRLQGPLVTESEIQKAVEHIRKQGRPDYVYQFLESQDADEGGADADEDLEDELYDQAVQLVTDSRQASISWVQRKLRVGYNRAARMIERMEREGVVSPGEGSKPREVLAQRIEG